LTCSRLNGIPACAHKQLLTDVLRKEWNFTGYVVSDEGALEFTISKHKYFNNSIDAAAVSMNAGTNLELSGNKIHPVYSYLNQALQQGKVTKQILYERLKPLFYTRMRLGEFDPPEMNPYTKLDLSMIQSPRHRELSILAAMKSFVMLKNSNYLPLGAKVNRMAVSMFGLKKAVVLVTHPTVFFSAYSTFLLVFWEKKLHACGKCESQHWHRNFAYVCMSRGCMVCGPYLQLPPLPTLPPCQSHP
jgi:beta-glucosidase-like glycosyl hydrolase